MLLHILGTDNSVADYLSLLHLCPVPNQLPSVSDALKEEDEV